MRLATAHYWRRLPHELGRLPLTYFQTLFEATLEDAPQPPTRNGDDGENEDAVSVDVDALIRKGQRQGFAGA
jgi:hypothetical protein